MLDAARRLHGVARVTPLLEAEGLNALAGRRVLVKAECLQRTGSFKFRGAYNKIAGLPEADRRPGVLAWSSGNHAQGVAAAASMFGVSAKIVMPRQAPAIKIARTRALGADLVLYDIATEDREAIGREIAAAEGRTVVPPYDDPAIIAGQGTVGNELANQCLAAGVLPDAVLIPCGGGGLSAGTGLAIRAKLPSTAIYLAEPAGFDDTARSLRAGSRQRVEGQPSSICDAFARLDPGRADLCAQSGAGGGRPDGNRRRGAHRHEGGVAGTENRAGAGRRRSACRGSGRSGAGRPWPCRRRRLRRQCGSGRLCGGHQPLKSEILR